MRNSPAQAVHRRLPDSIPLVVSTVTFSNARSCLQCGQTRYRRCSRFMNCSGESRTPRAAESIRRCQTDRGTAEAKATRKYYRSSRSQARPRTPATPVQRVNSKTIARPSQRDVSASRPPRRWRDRLGCPSSRNDLEASWGNGLPGGGAIFEGAYVPRRRSKSIVLVSGEFALHNSGVEHRRSGHRDKRSV